MEINNKTVEVLANTLKIDAAVLSEQLTVAGEPKVSELLSDKEVFLKSELDVLLKNTQKDGYEKGKIAGVEMDLKAYKEETGLKGLEGLKSHKDVVNYIIESKTKTGNVDEVVKQYKTENEGLRKNYTDLEMKLQEAQQTFEQYKINAVVTNKIESAINGLVIDADSTLVNGQKEALKDQWLKNFSIKVIDGKEYVVNSTGEKLVDRLQNPISVSDSLKDFAPKYVKLKTEAQGGRGAQSSQNNKLSGDLGGIKTKGEFEAYLKSKDISPLSNEAMALYKEVFMATKA